MGGGLVHLEILGPRAGLDGWLATLQDAGCCHLADALAGLVGEPGIGRPRPRPEERRAGELRSGPLLALRSLEGVLPPAPARGPDEPLETWSLPPGGVDEDELARRCEEALALATRIAGAFQAVREAEAGAAVPEGSEALEAARRALAARLQGDGALARRALDGLEDAEARVAAQRLLAATGHVAAARVYVPQERVPDLLERLDRAHAASVVVRALPPREDAPAPHAPPPVLPFQALGELAPARFGPRAAMGTLVAVASMVTAFEWAEGAYALALLAASAALGWRSRAATPRRGAAWTLLLLGLSAFAGMLCGGSWFGTFGAHGLAPGLTPGSRPFVRGPRATELWVSAVACASVSLLAYALLGGLLHLGRSTCARWFAAAASLVLPALLLVFLWEPRNLARGWVAERGLGWSDTLLLAAEAWIGLLLLVGVAWRAWALLADAATLLLCLVLCGVALAWGSYLFASDDAPSAPVAAFLGSLAMLVGAALTRWRGPRDVWNETARPPFRPWRRTSAPREVA